MMVNAEHIERAAHEVNARLRSAAGDAIRDMSAHETVLAFSGLDLYPLALERLKGISAATGIAAEALVDREVVTVAQAVASGVLHGFLLGRLVEQGGRRAAA